MIPAFWHDEVDALTSKMSLKEAIPVELGWGGLAQRPRHQVERV